MPKVDGTERTRTLIANIVRDLHSRRPFANHVEYSIKTGFFSELCAEEQGDTFRNVSHIYLSGMHAAIGNKTGNILMSKPWYMSTKRAVKRICAFLELIQPERLSKARIVRAKSNVWDNPPEAGGLAPLIISNVSQTLYVEGTKVTRKIEGYNKLWSGEGIEEYQTL